MSKRKFSYYYENPATKDRTLCSEIFYDMQTKSVSVVNHTDLLIHRAFGIKDDPTWTDFELFLESRCFPKDRQGLKLILAELGLENIGYDPLAIVKVTEGRMAEDNLILIEEKL